MQRWFTVLIPLALALAITAGTADAKKKMRVGDRYQGTTLTLETQPRMAIIPDTDVYYVLNPSDADLYRYGNSWYFVEDGNWYRAGSWRGPFTYIRMSSVPVAVRTVPAGYRRTWVTEPAYVTTGRIDYGDPYRGTVLMFTTEPGMRLISGTRVYVARDGDLDLYRYGSTWYYRENGRWYRANDWDGTFVHVRTSSVPRAVRTVPERYRVD